MPPCLPTLGKKSPTQTETSSPPKTGRLLERSKMIALRRPWRLLTLFALLSGADLLLTCRLLGDPDAEAYEANWLAAHILGHYGFSGLVMYKGLLFALIGGGICLVGHLRTP